ncbi:MAG: lipopolysaccharide biosynthesis protein [Gemmatimonadaceae bacterium]
MDVVKTPTQTPYTPTSDTRDLDRSLVRGVAWTGAVKWLSQVVTWLGTILVARLLTPEDYGLVGMATVYLGLTALVTEFGLGSAIVALRELGDREIAQLNAVALMIGGGALLLSTIVAAPLAAFFRAPELTTIVLVLSSTFLIDSLRTVPNALLTRDLRFKTLALLEGAKAIFTMGLTIAFALAGLRYWALVLGGVAGSLFWTLAILMRRSHPFAWPQLALIRSSLAFSSQIIIERVSWYAYSNADFLIAGRILGTAALGNYTTAWTIASLPGEKIMSLFWRVTPAVFSAVKNDMAALRRYVLLMSEAVAMALFPATVGLALVAPDFVMALLGEKWAGAIMPLRLLCLYATMHMISTVLPHVLIVTNQVRFATKLALAALVTLPPAFWLFGSMWGVAGIAAGWLVVYPFILLALFRRAFRTISLDVGAYARALWPAVSTTLVMATVVALAREVMPASWPAAIRLAGAVALGGAAYVGAALVGHGARIRSLMAMLRSARGATPT